MWSYDDLAGVQRLVNVLALCPTVTGSSTSAVPPLPEKSTSPWSRSCASTDAAWRTPSTSLALHGAIENAAKDGNGASTVVGSSASVFPSPVSGVHDERGQETRPVEDGVTVVGAPEWRSSVAGTSMRNRDATAGLAPACMKVGTSLHRHVPEKTEDEFTVREARSSRVFGRKGRKDHRGPDR
jgi:hypothetical protein